MSDPAACEFCRPGYVCTSCALLASLRADPPGVEDPRLFIDCAGAAAFVAESGCWRALLALGGVAAVDAAAAYSRAPPPADTCGLGALFDRVVDAHELPALLPELPPLHLNYVRCYVIGANVDDPGRFNYSAAYRRVAGGLPEARRRAWSRASFAPLECCAICLEGTDAAAAGGRYCLACRGCGGAFHADCARPLDSCPLCRRGTAHATDCACERCSEAADARAAGAAAFREAQRAHLAGKGPPPNLADFIRVRKY